MHKTRLDGTGLWGQLLICTLGQLLLGPGGHASGGRPAREVGAARQRQRQRQMR